jgi:hypothetical protein
MVAFLAHNQTVQVRVLTSPPKKNGVVAQLVRALPCHGRGCGFESRQFRHEDVPFGIFLLPYFI